MATSKDYGLTENTPLTSGRAGGSAHSRLCDATPARHRPFKRSLFIALWQIARNPFFFFRLVFLVTRRDAARLARRVGFWARRAGD